MALDRQHEAVDAIAVMERKLALVERTWPEPGARPADGSTDPRGPDRRAWYRTRANRGTVRIHAALPRLMGGDTTARAEVEAGLADIRQSIALNPAAHFGRERWQAYAVAGLLRALDDDL